LSLSSDLLVSKFAFKFNLHRYTSGSYHRWGISDYGLTAEEAAEEGAGGPIPAGGVGSNTTLPSHDSSQNSTRAWAPAGGRAGSSKDAKDGKRLAWERKGWAAAAARVEQAMRLHAPVDGIVGFSEGSAVAVLVALKQQRERERQQQQQQQEERQREQRREWERERRERGLEEGQTRQPHVPPVKPPPPPPPPPPLSFVVSVAGFAMDVPALARNLLDMDIFEEPLLVPTLHAVGALYKLNAVETQKRPKAPGAWVHQPLSCL
jgi:hypothetical protein